MGCAQVAPHWEEIVAQRTNWNRRHLEADALRRLTPDDLRRFHATHVQPGGDDRRPLLVLVDKGDAPTRRPTGDDYDTIDDALKFAATLPMI